MPFAVCTRCCGRGYIEKVVRGRCPVCRGFGRIGDRKCCRCGGAGITTYIDKVRCNHCRGSGKIGY